MTKRQEEIIKDNLRSYKANFDFIKIEDADYGGGFYVFTSEERAKNGDWTQYCYNIDYLNGWFVIRMCSGGKWDYEEKTGGIKMEKERKFKGEMKKSMGSSRMA